MIQMLMMVIMKTVKWVVIVLPLKRNLIPRFMKGVVGRGRHKKRCRMCCS
jgi:hypothetical protein